MTSNTFSKNISGLSFPAPSSNGTIANDDLIAYIKSTATHFGHGVGSCSMAPHGASWGVVDPDFRVRDTQGLRVVDASVFVSFLRLLLCCALCSFLISPL
jgi:choline dehydrogenase